MLLPSSTLGPCRASVRCEQAAAWARQAVGQLFCRCRLQVMESRVRGGCCCSRKRPVLVCQAPLTSFARSGPCSQELRAVAPQGWAVGMLGSPWELEGPDVSPVRGCGRLVT